MADFTHLNLKDDVEDSAVGFGLSWTLEARFAREPLGMHNGGVSYQRLAPNERGPFGHRHERQEEVYVVVGGDGRVKVEDDVRELRRWDALRVGPGAMRQFEAGSEGLELIVFGAPNTGPGDAEIARGWWSG